MRAIFMGTPQFAVSSLEALLSSRHRVLAVVTNPDRPAGRSLKVVPQPVKQFSCARNLTLLQPDNLADPSFIRALEGMEPDVGVVVAFSILPPELFGIPRRGCVNLHASLLPELRGAAPISWALMRGMTRTGLTTFLIERTVDTGSILMQETVDIEPDDDAGTLAARMSLVGARLLVRTLDTLEAGDLKPRPQQGRASKAPRLTPQVCLIDWQRRAEEIHNQVRGLAPSPGAFTYLDGRRLKLFRTRTLAAGGTGDPGLLESTSDGRALVQTGCGLLEILEVQLEGRRRMQVGEFLKGMKLASGTKLG